MKRVTVSHRGTENTEAKLIISLFSVSLCLCVRQNYIFLLNLLNPQYELYRVSRESYMQFERGAELFYIL